jgi:hypothetical protein
LTSVAFDHIPDPELQEYKLPMFTLLKPRAHELQKSVARKVYTIFSEPCVLPSPRLRAWINRRCGDKLKLVTKQELAFRGENLEKGIAGDRKDLSQSHPPVCLGVSAKTSEICEAGGQEVHEPLHNTSLRPNSVQRAVE